MLSNKTFKQLAHFASKYLSPSVVVNMTLDMDICGKKTNHLIFNSKICNQNNYMYDIQVQALCTTWLLINLEMKIVLVGLKCKATDIKLATVYVMIKRGKKSDQD